MALLGTGFICVAIWALARAWRRPDGSLNLLVAGLPVGAYPLLVGYLWLRVPVGQLRGQNPWEGAEPLYGTLWSYVNGMESPLVLMMFSLALLAYSRFDHWSERSAAWFGALLAGTVLARLDVALVVAPLWALAVVSAWPRRRFVVRITAAFVLPVLAYLAVNRLVFGCVLPVSGSLKSVAPKITQENFGVLAIAFNSFFGGDRPAMYGYWRPLQLAVPLLAALLAPLTLVSFQLQSGSVTCSWAGPNRRLSGFLAATGVGVLALNGYDFLFVPVMNQGHWYVPVSVLYVSLVVLHAAERFARRTGRRRAASRRGLAMWATALVALTVVVVVLFLKVQCRSSYHARYAEFALNEAPKVRAQLATSAPHLLEFDDGIVAWATGFPTMSATGYGLDRDGAEAKRRGDLVHLAVARGFDDLTSLVYVGTGGLGTTHSHLPGRDWHDGSVFGDLGAYDLTVLYRSEGPDFAIVKATPR